MYYACVILIYMWGRGRGGVGGCWLRLLGLEERGQGSKKFLVEKPCVRAIAGTSFTYSA